MRQSSIRRVGQAHGDPLEGVANLFDLGIVFALGFMVAVIVSMGLPEMFVREDVTLVKNPGSANMQVIRKRGTIIEHYQVSREQLGGEGERLGVAYRLKSGEVIYVPDDGEDK